MSRSWLSPWSLRLGASACALIVMATLMGASPAPRADAAVSSVPAQYRTWMVQARAMYPYKQSVDKMYRVMMCESEGYAGAVSRNGLYRGLFQYHRTTWGGSWNPYRNNSVFDARSQIFATAKAWSIGMQSHWECYYITAGR